MTTPAADNSDDDFLEVSRRLNLITPEQMKELSIESRRDSIAPESLSVQKGILDATQLEIVATVRRPRDTVPGYEILDVLGQGGMGVVFSARQLNLGRIVALKTVLVTRMTNPAALGRFEQEARTVAQLRHPNIIAAYDFGRHDGRLFFSSK